MAQTSDGPPRAPESSVLRVCAADESPPFSWRARDAGPSGLDVLVVQQLAQSMGRPLQWVWFDGELERDKNFAVEANALLSAGACDVLAGYPLLGHALGAPLQERARPPRHTGSTPATRTFVALAPVAATLPYRATRMGIVAPVGMGISGMADLRGRSVAVVAASMAALSVQLYAQGVLQPRMKITPPGRNPVDLVQAGQADVAMVDEALWDRVATAASLDDTSRGPGTALELKAYRHPVAFNFGLLVLAQRADLLAALNGALRALPAAALRRSAATAGATWSAPVSPPIRDRFSAQEFIVAD